MLIKPKLLLKGIDMKQQIWIIIISVILASGCAVSEKNPVSDNINQNPADQNNVHFSANNADSVANEDFDLLEEELIEQIVQIADPLEPVNRLMFNVNDALFAWILEPCAITCKKTLPESVRLGILNFFQNLTTPVRYVNCLLQGKLDAAGTESDRFIINTTVGILGFGDPAKDKHNIEPVQEDLGQTLAVFGFENGCYLVLPLLGPSTVRDSVGIVGDLFLNPVFYVEPAAAAAGISAGKHVNESSFHIGEYQTFKDAAVDPYIAMRQVYIQFRNQQIQE